MFTRTLLLCAVVPALTAQAGELPADATYFNGRTMEPKVIMNSGHLGWEPYRRDLARWPTLSYKDERSTWEPTRFAMKPPTNGDAERGRALAWNWCINCHALPGDQWPGNLGNPITHYKTNKHPDDLVFQQIYDPRVFNPATAMPPFGTFGLLSEQEIRDLVAYVQSIE